MSGKSLFRDLGAIVLAAGFSKRMGDENKLLKRFKDRPLISHVVERTTDLGLRQVFVIVGHDEDKIRPLMPHGVILISHPQAADGMGSSIAKGALALDPSLRGVFILLGDMPFIMRADYEKLAETLYSAKDNAICIPICEGQRGHPVLFGQAHFSALRKLKGDRGARNVLSRSNAEIFEVPVGHSGVLIDLDTPQAFADAERK